MAYSLFLFMRDIADADFVGWIDKQLATVDPHAPNRLAALREAVIGPLRNVYGVADKVLAVALADLLLSAGWQRPVWREVGATFVAIDTLVHLHFNWNIISQYQCDNSLMTEGGSIWGNKSEPFVSVPPHGAFDG
jgi:hypothetical protein